MAQPDQTGEPPGDGVHPHAPMVEEITDFEVLEIAVRELAIEKGLFTADDHRRFTEFAEQIGPTPAARLVAKAWLDPEFKRLALTNQDQLARSLATKFLTYATGRPATAMDRLDIDDIVDQLRPTHQGVRSLLHAVIQSRGFRGDP